MIAWLRRRWLEVLGFLGLGAFGGLLYTSCSSPLETTPKPATEIICPVQLVTVRASFILRCIGAANPMSDEDPEGWIKECDRVSVDLFCLEVIQ